MRSEAIAEEGSRKGDFLAGKYLLEHCLGIGGMGEVYRATNVSLDRKVAIKLLNADFAKNEDDVLRFLREARAAAAVRHPNVVDVIDVAREDDGTPFIVQELLSGEDLEQFLHNSGGRLSADEILDIMIPVADAISAAHAKQVIHRDLKPANIFLAREGSRIVPKVLDFGACLYKTMGGQSSKEARMLIGTPHYMAPEQVVADKELDARADVWAMGVIMYELLVGETPFEAENVNEVLKLVRTKRIPSIRQLAPETPNELRDVAKRCMSRIRADRYDDASAVREALIQARDAIRGPLPEPAPQSRRRADSRTDYDPSEVRTKLPAEPAAMPSVSSTPSLMLGTKANAKKGPTKRRGSALLTLSMPDEGVPSVRPHADPSFGSELDFSPPPPSQQPASFERPVAAAPPSAKAWPEGAAPSGPLPLDSDPNLAALDLDIGPRVPSSIPPVLNPRSAMGAPFPSSPLPMPAAPQRPSERRELSRRRRQWLWTAELARSSFVRLAVFHERGHAAARLADVDAGANAAHHGVLVDGSDPRSPAGPLARGRSAPGHHRRAFELRRRHARHGRTLARHRRRRLRGDLVHSSAHHSDGSRSSWRIDRRLRSPHRRRARRRGRDRDARRGHALARHHHRDGGGGHLRHPHDRGHLRRERSGGARHSFRGGGARPRSSLRSLRSPS